MQHYALAIALEAGDWIKLALRDSTTLEAKVISNDASGLVLKEKCSHRQRTLAWNEVASVQREEVSLLKVGRNWPIGVGVFLAIFAVSFNFGG